jgi:hypothetical protein
VCAALARVQFGSAIEPWPETPWYWQYEGRPVLLLGGSDDDNLFQWPADKLVPQLDRLAEAGGNVVRNTMSDRKDGGWEVYPYRQVDSGKYDLEQFNPEYWERFDRLLRETAARKIFVQIEVWDRFDYSDVGGRGHWTRHPYNPANNVNYTSEESGLATKYPDHPGANRNPFFFTTPKQRDNVVVRRFQERFVDEMMRRALPFDHVLYCIDNETSAEPAWGRYWCEFLKGRAREAGKRVMVTEMWDDWDLRAKRHRETFDHPELYDFVDVSQNNHNKGRKHWEMFLYVRGVLSSRPRPINTTKTYGADGDKFGHTDQDGVERFWRHLLAGAASVRFHRPDSGLGLNDKAVASIRAARKLESLVPLWTVEPADERLSECEPNEAYLAAGADRAFALYFPAGGEVQLDVGAPGEFEIRWIDVDSGEWGPAETRSASGRLPLASPGKGNFAAAVLRRP